MPLAQRREAFDDPDWLFELKYDGFRALAYVDGAGAKLFSRRDLRSRQFADLCSEISLELNADDAVLDGEIVKLGENGRPAFRDLMRRRGPFQFVAFDVLALNGKDVRKLELVDRKKLLRAIVLRRSSTILCAQHVERFGRRFFDVVCERDLEGIVAKRKASPYDARSPVAAWVKIKNPHYTDARDRHELFERTISRASDHGDRPDRV